MKGDDDFKEVLEDIQTNGEPLCTRVCSYDQNFSSFKTRCTVKP